MLFNPKKTFDQNLKKVFGVNLNESKLHLNKCRIKFGLETSVSFNQSLRLDRSQEFIFSAIALCKKVKVRKILEFGTFSGESTLVLRALFPSASITTIDRVEPYLTSNDNSTQRDQVKELRRKNIEKANAKLILKDSALVSQKELEEYDLIWLDGDHTYPVVVIDVANALNSLNQDGFLIMDDICKHVSISNLILRQYISTESWKTLVRLARPWGLDTVLFPKKLNLFQYLPGRRREMAVVRKETIQSVTEKASK